MYSKVYRLWKFSVLFESFSPPSSFFPHRIDTNRKRVSGGLPLLRNNFPCIFDYWKKKDGFIYFRFGRVLRLCVWERMSEDDRSTHWGKSGTLAICVWGWGTRPLFLSLSLSLPLITMMMAGTLPEFRIARIPENILHSDGWGFHHGKHHFQLFIINIIIASTAAASFGWSVGGRDPRSASSGTTEPSLPFLMTQSQMMLFLLSVDVDRSFTLHPTLEHVLPVVGEPRVVPVRHRRQRVHVIVEAADLLGLQFDRDGPDGEILDSGHYLGLFAPSVRGQEDESGR